MEKKQANNKKPELVPWIQRRGAKQVLVGSILIGIMVLLSLISLIYTPYNPNASSLSERSLPPFSENHMFGTDNLGRDMLSRVMKGGTVSLSIAALAIVGTTFIGAVLGLLSGYYGGWVDHLFNMIAEIQNSIPTMLLIILFLAVLGPSIISVAVVLAFADWVGIFRTVRSRTMVEKNKDYIAACRTMGASDARIIFRHLLPNVMTTIIVMSTLIIGTVIITEANLSYLGVGVARPNPSWGRMISDGESYIGTAPWISIVPAISVIISVIGINLAGDGLRKMSKME